MDFQNLSKSTPSLKAKPKKEKAKKEVTVEKNDWKDKHRGPKTRVGEPGNNVGIGSYKIIGQGCDVCDDTVMHVLNTTTMEKMCLDCGTVTKVKGKRAESTKEVLQRVIVQNSKPEVTYDILYLFL